MQLFNSSMSRTTRIGRYRKKHSPTHTHPDHQTSFINFLRLLQSLASSLFNLHAWQSFSTTSLMHTAQVKDMAKTTASPNVSYRIVSLPVLFGLLLSQGPSTSYSIHFFTQSSPSFRNSCPYHHSLFCNSTNVISTISNLSGPYLEICLLA